MAGERNGPDCGWCCWVLLAKSGWHCAACAPETTSTTKRKSYRLTDVLPVKTNLFINKIYKLLFFIYHWRETLSILTYIKLQYHIVSGRCYIYIYLLLLVLQELLLLVVLDLLDLLQLLQLTLLLQSQLLLLLLLLRQEVSLPIITISPHNVRACGWRRHPGGIVVDGLPSV